MSTHHTFTTTVDVVALALHEGQIYVLLIQRAHEPFAGSWALPGGHVDEGEDLKAAALRELEEEAKVCPVGPTIQVGTFGNPNRDPRGHVISTAFLILFPELVGPEAADDAADARWFPLSEAQDLAFDHDFVIQLALTKVEIRLGEHLELVFTSSALQQEQILEAADRVGRDDLEF